MQELKPPSMLTGLLLTTLLLTGIAGSQSARGQYRVRGAGALYYGGLGNGKTTGDTYRTNVPVAAAGSISGKAISASGTHCLLLKSNGTVWEWGSDYFGQLPPAPPPPDSSPLIKFDPVQINGLANVTSIAAGGSHNLAVKADGTVWAWGYNFQGELGNGTTVDSTDVPVQVSGLTDVKAVAAGVGHSVALKNDGTVWAWGSNIEGQLGSRTFAPYRATAQQIPGVNNAVAVSAGWMKSLALTADGTVWGWGGGGYAGVVSGLDGVIAISSSVFYNLALKSDGTVWIWGNVAGPPTQVNGLTDITAISAGYNSALALQRDGTVLAWGDNSDGQLGDGAPFIGSDGPVPMVRTGHVRSIQAADYNSYLLTDDADPDVNGDGHHDLVWQNTQTGDLSSWYLSGAAWYGGYDLLGTGVPTAWKTAASVDLNGDGKTDLVWQNTQTGDVSYWLMDGTQRAASDFIARNIPLQWKIVGAADFNGDGKPDLLWQNTQTGDVTVWYMNGAAWTGAWDYIAHNVPTQWQIAGTGSLSGQSGFFRQSDLLWRNVQTGDVVVWYMIGAAWTGSYDTIASGIPLHWRLAAVSDINNDLNQDLLWQNTQTGDVVVWYMQGAFWNGSYDALAQGIPLQWSLVRTH